MTFCLQRETESLPFSFHGNCYALNDVFFGLCVMEMINKKQYTDVEITKLKELWTISQKALQLGNNYLEQANAAYQSCKMQL